MFGKGKSGPADELYLEQKGRNGNYSHDYEYRTIGALNIEKFDLELNAQARSGWELAGFQVSGDDAHIFYATLRRPRNP